MEFTAHNVIVTNALCARDVAQLSCQLLFYMIGWRFIRGNFENLEICGSVVWFRADLVSGVTLCYISLVSVISEMRE
jgi:hypothetical protein